MGRHPGIQHGMRMEEIAKQMTYTSGTIQEGFARIRRLEQDAADTKAEIAEAQKKLDALLILQGTLIHAQMVNEFGLPSGITKEEFEAITGHEITS
jgi:hypothetical protein